MIPIHYIKVKFKLLLIIAYKIYQKLLRMLYSIRYPFIARQISKIQVVNIQHTINSLINSHKSISRFGDGEISWMFGNNKYGSFEESSTLLRHRLLQVLTSNKSNLEIGLPDAFRDINAFTPHVTKFWKGVLSKYWKYLHKYLNKNKIYYNTNLSRCYMDYKNKNNSKILFHDLKKIWNNRNLLIIEGQYSRLGATDNLFSNTKSIRRIECPPVNAFEHYNKILNVSKFFLNNHKNYLTLISLGPSATILAYDLSNLGYQSIDIGHIDLEYDWFRMGATKKVNIATKYVNSFRIKNGKHVQPIDNSSYENEIYCYINE